MKSGNYFLDIANIYSRIIKESPDNITVIDNEGKRKYFSYDDTPDSYTCLIGSDGKYVMSKKIIGHYNLLDAILKEDEENLASTIITNADDVEDLKRLARERIKTRIWKNQKVYSMWDRYDPSYEDAIKDSLKAIGENYQDYKYDNEYEEYENFRDADTFFVNTLTDEQKEKKMKAEMEKRASDRALADMIAGVRRKASSDYDAPYKKPSWMNREGD
jgi:hypothetical protein